MHPPAATAHTAVTERQRFDQHHCRIPLHARQSPDQVFHVLDMLRYCLIVHAELHKDEVGFAGYMQGKAEGEVV
jgi:hypothetical protein